MPDGQQTHISAIGDSVGVARERVDIRDLRFLRDVQRLRSLRSFEAQAAPSPAAEMPPSFGALMRLRYSPWGRLPSDQEWAEVDRLSAALLARLPMPLKKAFARSQIPGLVAHALPVALLSLACYAATQVIYLLADIQTKATSPTDPLSFIQIMGSNPIKSDPDNIMVYCLIWAVSMGCLGAIAFVGMNAIAVQEDATFDLSCERLLTLRVVLGGLFALVMTLPFGTEGFVSFWYHTATGLQMAGQANGASPPSDVVGQVLVLTLPFLLGFSTPFVITVLNQFIDAAQAFFGRRQQTPGPAAPAPQQIP